jgi:hypothetical protein
MNRGSYFYRKKQMKQCSFWLRVIPLLTLSLCSFAQTGSTPKQEEKKWFWGADLRLRPKTWNNIWDTTDTKDDRAVFMRVRPRIWGGIRLGSGISFQARLTNEFRPYLKIYPKKDFTIHEFVLDNLYLEMKGTLHRKLTLRVGRQDLMLGEGLVIMEGNPGDGSRTIYFNAIRATVALNKGSLDAFAVVNPGKERYLPVIHNQNVTLIERAEEGAGLYWTRELSKNWKGEFYGIYKHEEARGKYLESEIGTWGSRVSGKSSSGFEYILEWALQHGTYGSHGRLGNGGYAELRKKLPKAPVTFRFNYTQLSGDDAGTTRQEGWNPIFSRWPKWSELYIYTQTQEQGVAYWTNVRMFSPGLTWVISNKRSLDFTYRKMNSLQPRTFSPPNSALSGFSRGHLWISRYTYKINRHWSTYLLSEILKPGSYYPEGKHWAYFLRWETMLTF